MGDAERVLNSGSGLDSLRAAGSTALSEVRDPAPSGALSPIVAGTSIDLSGEMDCTDTACLRRRVDDVLSHIWHYFDQVVVQGAPLGLAYERDDDDTRRWILPFVDTFLYVREIGVEGELLFQPRPSYCVHILEDWAKEFGLENVLAQREAVTAQLLDQPGGLFAEPPVWDDGMWSVVANTLDQHVFTAHLDIPRDTTEADLARAVAELHFHGLADRLFGDIVLARSVEAPLATALPQYRRWLTDAKAVPTEGQVAYELALPVIENVPIRELIKIRKDEWPSFRAFQQSLQEAIRERVKVAAAGDDPGKIAREISADLIEPALNEIDRRLESASRAFRRKALSHAFVGSAITTVGLVLQVPMVAAAGVGALGLTLPHLDKFFEQRQEVEMSDMYFLWDLARRSNPSV